MSRQLFLQVADPAMNAQQTTSSTVCQITDGRLYRAVQGAGDGLWEWDLQTNQVWYAPEFLELLGYTAEEYPGELESWFSRIHQDDYHNNWNAIHRHLLEGDEYNVQYRLLTNSGSFSWFRVCGKAYHDETGKAICMAGSIRDIDDLKAAEQKLREKESQLVQQQKLDAVGSLASGIAHEFNNLLQTIRGYTKFAMDTLAEESQAHQDLQHVLSAAQRATTLTRQLLDFSRSEVGCPRPERIDTLVNNLLEMLQPILSIDVELRVQLNAPSAWVCIDAQQIQQALLNLCINARDAMPEGGVLTISSEIVTLTQAQLVNHRIQRGEFVQLTVSDTGSGIAPEIQSRIFEPFYTTKDFGKGTGLGLAITLGVVQQAGGFIECTSQVDAGSAFQIHLPVCEERSLEIPVTTNHNFTED